MLACMLVLGLLWFTCSTFNANFALKISSETSTNANNEDSSETGEFDITTEPAFDLLPEGYDQNLLEQIDNEDFDEDEKIIENE